MNKPSSPDTELHVLFVATCFDPAHRFGGPVAVNLAMAAHLSRLPATRVSVLTTDAERPKSLDRMKVARGWHIRSEGFWVCYCRIANRRGWSWEMLRRLPGTVRRADCVHLVSAFDWIVPVTLVLARLFGKSVLWAPHGAIQEVMLAQNRPRLKKVWLWGLRRIVRGQRIGAIAPSDHEVDAFRRLIPDIPIDLVPHGVTVPPDAPAGGTKDDETLGLVVFSRLVPQKGLDRLLRALPLMQCRAWLDIYGEGPELDRLRALSAVLAIEDRVRFHGFAVPERHAAILAAADLLVLPSIWESFGMVVLEALARGVPVLASTGSSWSALEREGCGFWRDPTPESLAAALDEASRSDLRAMGERGRAWVTASFGWPRAARREAALARELCGLAP